MAVGGGGGMPARDTVVGADGAAVAALAVRSLSRADLELGASRLLPPCDLRIAAPPVLRLPVHAAPPGVMQIDPRLPPPTVSSFRFTPHSPAAAPPRPAERAPRPATDRAASPARRTRIRPPRDVVKLSEKFFYLLQPDLETTLRSDRLEFPRQPFPFQLEGMAFLVPRHAAVLADEMGLGKSMQAISAIRLLVRSGEARRVLVV